MVKTRSSARVGSAATSAPAENGTSSELRSRLKTTENGHRSQRPYNQIRQVSVLVAFASNIAASMISHFCPTATIVVSVCYCSRYLWTAGGSRSMSLGALVMVLVMNRDLLAIQVCVSTDVQSFVAWFAILIDLSPCDCLTVFGKVGKMCKFWYFCRNNQALPSGSVGPGSGSQGKDPLAPALPGRSLYQHATVSGYNTQDSRGQAMPVTVIFVLKKTV